MSDIDLIRAVTVERDDYVEAFHVAARQELANRNIGIDGMGGTLEIAYNDSPASTINTADIEQIPFEKADKWDTWACTNFVNEALVLQKEISFWSVHHFHENRYRKSFICENISAMRLLLQTFSQLGDWEMHAASYFSLEDWITLTSSESIEHTENIMMILDDLAVPYTVRSNSLWRFNMVFGGDLQDSKVHVLVPQSHFNIAADALAEMQATIARLYKEVKKLDDNSAPEAELKLYEKLSKLVPYDGVVFFNKAVVLFELERYEDAVDAFCTAAPLLHDQPILRRETLDYLLGLMEEIPTHVPLLHGTATIYSELGRVFDATQIYQKILEINPADAVAHLNIGYLLLPNPGQRNQAVAHIKTYLELEPDSEDRQALESIISGA